MAGIKDGKESDKRYQKACEKYARAIELKADYPQAFINYGFSSIDSVRVKKSELLLEEGNKKYAQPVEWKSDYHDTYYYWGFLLMSFSGFKRGKEKTG